MFLKRIILQDLRLIHRKFSEEQDPYLLPYLSSAYPHSHFATSLPFSVGADSDSTPIMTNTSLSCFLHGITILPLGISKSIFSSFR